MLKKACIFENSNITDTYNFDCWGNGEITENRIKAYIYAFILYLKYLLFY